MRTMCISYLWRKIMTLQEFLNLFRAEYHIRHTLSDGTKIFLSGSIIL